MKFPKVQERQGVRNVINILPIESDERICASLILPEEIGEESLIMVTKNGLIKRTGT